MPTLEWNVKKWCSTEHWDKVNKGENWSGTWGNSNAQWLGFIYPRIANWLPCGTMLEIAPGYGRWTRHLVDLATDFYAVDLSPVCIDYCRNIWGDKGHFESNDGHTIPFENKFDFIFSFDSLVHVEADCLEHYIRKSCELLTDNGAAFIHHSNLKDPNLIETTRRGARAESVGHNLVADWVHDSGCHVAIQELLNWNSDALIDCFTLITKQNIQQTEIIENNDFFTQCIGIKSYIAPYCKTPSY